MEQENTEKNSAKGEKTANLSVKERREQVLDQIFGKNRKEYQGNIWGWRFSIFGAVFIAFTAGFAIYGTQKGWINWDDRSERTGIFGKKEQTTKPKIDSSATK
jgi:hypothetical protein